MCVVQKKRQKIIETAIVLKIKICVIILGEARDQKEIRFRREREMVVTSRDTKRERERER